MSRRVSYTRVPQPPVKLILGVLAHSIFIAHGGTSLSVYIQRNDRTRDTWHRYTLVSVTCSLFALTCGLVSFVTVFDKLVPIRITHNIQQQIVNTETLKIMMNNRCSSLFLLLLVIGIVVGSESYLDYGDETADRNLENLREFYRMLLRRNSMDNSAMIGSPLEHLMIRKSQRSPSLRLRFGRSGPPLSTGVLTRPMDSQSAFEDN